MSNVSLVNQSYQSSANDAILPHLVRDIGGRPMVSSRDVARDFGKRHDNALRAITNLECSQEFRLLNFEESEYPNEQGKLQPEVLMTRDGFCFLVFKFTGVKAARFTEHYIAAFNEYEKAHKEMGRKPLVPQAPADLLRFAATEIDRLNGVVAIVQKERDDVRDWIPLSDAWRLVPGYAAIASHPGKNELRDLLKEISWDLQIQPRQQLITASNGTTYRPYLFHISVWAEYMSRKQQ